MWCVCLPFRFSTAVDFFSVPDCFVYLCSCVSLVSASVVASHACWLVKPVCLSVVAAFFWRSLWFGSSCFFFALMYCDISGEEQEDLPLARKIGDWTGPATRDIGANWEMGIWICAIGQAWRRKQDMACVANQPHSQVCPPGAYRDIVYRGVQRFLGGEGLLCLHFYRLLSGGHVCIHHSPRTCHLQITAIAPTPTPSLATTTRKNSTGEYEEDATTAVATSMAVSVCERDDRT